MYFISKLSPLIRGCQGTGPLRSLTSAPDGNKVTRKKNLEQDVWESKLKIFASESNEEGWFVKLMRAPIDLRPASIRKWWGQKKEDLDAINQRFIPERHKVLGNDLATAHFILFRGGKVKFWNDTNWLEGKEHNLPRVFDPGFLLEAVDVSDVDIYYEGLFNFVDLHHLKRLIFRNCPHFDDWCLDYISGELKTLEHLDLHNCQNVTHNGLACLYRLSDLKFLDVTNIPQNDHFKLTCLLLEENLPGLKVQGIDMMYN